MAKDDWPESTETGAFMEESYRKGRMPQSIAMVGWQPIETAPRDGTPIMLGFAGAGVSSGLWWRGGWARGPAEQNDLSPTHWMPLPEPPRL